MLKNILFLCGLLFLCFVLLCSAQSPSPTTTTAAQDENANWLNQLDIYAKVFAVVITSLGTIFGLPLVVLNFQKTRAEIRKLELEAAALQNETYSSEAVSQYSNRIEIINSDYNNIKILADPRFLAPLLLLLDFIFAWGILTLAGYAFGVVIPGVLSDLLIGLLAAILLIPIIREARRVKRVLHPQEKSQNNESDTKE